MTNSDAKMSTHDHPHRDESDNNGFEELEVLLDPAVTRVLRESRLWQLCPRNLVTYLVHTCSRSPWFNHLSLASVVYASSRVADPCSCVMRVHRFLRWAIPKHFPDLAHLQLEKAIVTYFGEPPQPCGINLYKSYNALQIHIERFLASLPPEQRLTLDSFRLPALFYSRSLSRLTSQAEEKMRRNRKGKAFAVVHRLPDLVALARQRYRWLSELDVKLQIIRESLQRGETNLPAVITLKSPENQADLRFRVWDAQSWSLAHSQAPSHSTPTLVQERLFLQLVGEMPEHPWFLRAVECGVLQGSGKLSAKARQYIAEWETGKLNAQHPGLLTLGEPGLSLFLHWAREMAAQTPEDSAVLFCLEPFLTAAVVGLFVVVSIVSTGMRIGELQQVTLDRECMEMLELPEYDDGAQAWIKGSARLYWRLYPKGSQKRERYLVTPYMNEALFLLLDLHKRFFGEHGLHAVVCGGLANFTHTRRYPGQHRFVLQWSGKHISGGSLTQCLKFLLLEHVCRDEQGRPVRITAHLLRHGVAGWLRQKGFPLEDIMALLKQVNIAVTDYYSQLSPEQLHQKLGPAITALAELAGTDPTEIRNIDEIHHLAQDAFLRYGVLRHTSGGYCGTFNPCMVHFACATCRFYVPDPRRRAEVMTKLVLSEKIVAWRREAGDPLEADNEQVHRREWERILKEMDALEQVPLVSPSADAVLQNLADEDLEDLFLPHPTEHLALLSEGKVTDDQTTIDRKEKRSSRVQSTQPSQVSTHRRSHAPSHR